MIVHSPYLLEDLLSRRPELADLSLSAKVREAVRESA